MLLFVYRFSASQDKFFYGNGERRQGKVLSCDSAGRQKHPCLDVCVGVSLHNLCTKSPITFKRDETSQQIYLSSVYRGRAFIETSASKGLNLTPHPS